MQRIAGGGVRYNASEAGIRTATSDAAGAAAASRNISPPRVSGDYAAVVSSFSGHHTPAAGRSTADGSGGGGVSKVGRYPARMSAAGDAAAAAVSGGGGGVSYLRHSSDNIAPPQLRPLAQSADILYQSGAFVGSALHAAADSSNIRMTSPSRSAAAGTHLYQQPGRANVGSCCWWWLGSSTWF